MQLYVIIKIIQEIALYNTKNNNIIMTEKKLNKLEMFAEDNEDTMYRYWSNAIQEYISIEPESTMQELLVIIYTAGIETGRIAGKHERSNQINHLLNNQNILNVLKKYRL
jgi:hypothetical protein